MVVLKILLSYDYECNVVETSNYLPAEKISIYIIDKAESEVDLVLDGNEEDITINETTTIEIDASLITPSSGIIEVYENGTLIDGDQLMALVAKSWSETDRLSAGGIVSTVMSNLGLERYLEGLGLTLVRTKVGDRYVVKHMREHGFNVGGEQSGHIVLSDFSTTGDGLIAALQVLAVICKSGKKVSEACRLFEPFPQLLRNVRVSNGAPWRTERVEAAIRDGEAKLKGKGRLVI